MNLNGYTQIQYSNNSDNNTIGNTNFQHNNHGHGDILELNNEFKRDFLSYTYVQILFCILGVSGNILIIHVYKNKLQKKREGRFFIILLAVVDVLHCIVSSTLVFIKNLKPLTFPDKWTCKSLIYGTNWLFILSLFVLLLICIERYCKICRPLRNQFNCRSKLIMSVTSVIFAVIIPLPRLVYFEVREIHLGNLTGNVCGPNMNITGADIVIPGILYFNFILSGAVILILVVLYSFVGHVIYFHKNRSAHQEQLADRFRKSSFVEYSEEFNKERSDETIRNSLSLSSTTTGCSFKRMQMINRATIMFMMVTFVTIISYIPLWIFVFVDVLDPARWFEMPDAELHFFLFLRALSVASYLSNPFIYAYYDSKFRDTCANIMRGCYRKTTEKEGLT